MFKCLLHLIIYFIFYCSCVLCANIYFNMHFGLWDMHAKLEHDMFDREPLSQNLAEMRLVSTIFAFYRTASPFSDNSFSLFLAFSYQGREGASLGLLTGPSLFTHTVSVNLLTGISSPSRLTIWWIWILDALCS